MSTPSTGQPLAVLPPDQRKKLAISFLSVVSWRVFNLRGTRGSATADPGGTIKAGQARTTMRLFASGVQLQALREILQTLADGSPEKALKANGVVQPGTWYHKAAWWVRDAQSTNSGDATYTIFREVSDGPVSEVGVVDDGCGSTTTIRYVWDAASIEDLPATGQGFSSKVAGISRDPDTGLFNYYVATTERKTTTLPEYETAESAFSEAFEALLFILEKRRGDAQRDLGSLAEPAAQRVREFQSQRVPKRLFAGDASLWTDDPAEQAEVKKRLGWL